MRLHSTQPAVSAQLKRLRALTGDPLLVRAGNGMTPTETALQLLDPASRLLQDADRLFSRALAAAGFEPAAQRAHLSHRRQRLPRPAVPARTGGAPQARSALGAARAAAAVGRLRLPAQPGQRRGRPGDRQLARAAGRTAPGPADVRRDRLPGGRGPSGSRVPTGRAPGRSSGTWPASTWRRRRCMPPVLAARRRDRRAPAIAGLRARHRGAQRALQPDPADGGTEPAGADHRPAVLLALRRQAAGAHRALPGRLPALDLLPALARPDPCVAAHALVARTGARCRAEGFHAQRTSPCADCAARPEVRPGHAHDPAHRPAR